MHLILSLFSYAILGINAGALSDDIDTTVVKTPIWVGAPLAPSANGVRNQEDFSNLSSSEIFDLLHKLAENSTTAAPVVVPAQPATAQPMKPDSTDLLDNSTATGVLPPGPMNPNDSGKVRCQNTDNFLFIVTAMACKDDNTAICERMFDAPDVKTGRRDPRCDQQEFETIAKTCRKRCATCCEDLAYSCENDDSGLVDCNTNLGRCENPKYFQTMSKYCGGSCGLCQKTACRDSHPDCRTMKAVCMSPEHQDTMKANCARTCGFCAPGGPEISAPAPAPEGGSGQTVPDSSCVDLAKNCNTRAMLCNNAVYSTYMAKYCAKTCNKCGQSAGGASCIDSNPRCSAWVPKGFCTNQYYTTDYKRQHCAKSCGLC